MYDGPTRPTSKSLPGIIQPRIFRSDFAWLATSWGLHYWASNWPGNRRRRIWDDGSHQWCGWPSCILYRVSSSHFPSLSSFISSSLFSLLHFASIIIQRTSYHAFHSIFAMQLSTFLVVVTAVYATAVSGKWFKTGQHWGDHGVAKAQLANACVEMKGNYDPSEVYGTCRNSPSANVSFKFEIENETGGRINISEDECRRNIGAQIDHCGHGGQITVSGVRFRYVLWINRVVIYKTAVADTHRGDPNKGKC